MPRRLSQCHKLDGSRKPGYRTWAKANEVRNRVIEGGAFPPSVHVYECPQCSLWHVGRSIDPESGRRRHRRRRVGEARTA